MYKAVYQKTPTQNQVHRQLLQIDPNFSKKQKRQVSKFELIQQQAIKRANARKKLQKQKEEEEAGLEIIDPEQQKDEEDDSPASPDQTKIVLQKPTYKQMDFEKTLELSQKISQAVKEDVSPTEEALLAQHYQELMENKQRKRTPAIKVPRIDTSAVSGATSTMNI